VTATSQMETADCALGCRRDDELVFVGRDRLHGLPGEFQVVRCRTCGLLRTDPRPTPAEMSLYYPNEYGPHQCAGEAAPLQDGRRPWRRGVGSLAWRLADSRAESLPPMTPGRLLEVGCASGSFLDRMAKVGWSVEGIEFSESAAARASRLGYAIHRGRLEEAPAPAEPFDIVVGWMALEHLHDPLKSIEKLRSWVKPGGWLALSVPDAGSVGFTIFRSAWYPVDLPRHLYHFDRRTLRLLLEKGGWRVRRFITQRTVMDFIASFGYVLGDTGIAPGLSEWLKKAPERPGRLPLLLFPLSYLLSFLRQTGRMTVWAQRLDD
jgi:2-polyprenyl-3-methyl-5-hydroxy-6-metoxy-1,4-benzoquinol methylase